MALSRPRKFHSLFLDADITPPLREILECVGFTCLSVNDPDLRKRMPQDAPDWDVLREARRRRRVLVSFDKHEDAKTKYAWSEELERRGGHVIQISRGPEQHPIEAAGKILIHYDAWQEFFRRNDTAVATLDKNANPKLWDRQEIFKPSPATLRQINTPVEPRKPGSRSARRRRQAPQEQQLPLDGA